MNEKFFRLCKIFMNIPKEVLYSILLICITLPLINPLKIPLPISERVKLWYDYIENLPDNAYVIFSIDYDKKYIGMIEEFAVATLHHLFSRNVRIVFISFYKDGPFCYESLISKANPESYGKNYGIDYVFLGYIANAEESIKRIANDFNSIVEVDYYGKMVNEILMLKHTRSANDFDMIISFYGVNYKEKAVPYIWMSYWRNKYNVTLLICVCEVTYYVDPPPYIPVGDVLICPSSIAQYEYLIDKPGVALGRIDALSLSLSLLILLIIMVNIVEIIIRIKE